MSVLDTLNLLRAGAARSLVPLEIRREPRQWAHNHIESHGSCGKGAQSLWGPVVLGAIRDWACGASDTNVIYALDS
jgi:hypothetical protein